ncbi:MAG TPA: Hsp20/alpha crystallin family protein [Anaerolineaceae bacterium]|nr:Hsp20/alpha crystallin family protein [Anaerolineaceae bacterium]
MTLYITPVGRFARRRMENLAPETLYSNRLDTDVVFPVDVKLEQDAFEIVALLPGVAPEDVEVQVINETVTIQGEMKDERDENARYLVVERPSGRFCRTLTLPVSLDSAHAEAKMENGVLTLRIPKAETARPKTIKVGTMK